MNTTLKLQAQITCIDGPGRTTTQGYSWDSVASMMAKIEELTESGNLISVEFTKSVFED